MFTFFSLLLLATALGELSRIDFGNGIAIILLDIFAAFSFIFLIIKIFTNKQILLTPMTKPLCMFLSIALASLVINMHFLSPLQFFTSLLYLVRFLSYISLFFLTFGLDKQTKQKILILAFGSGILVLLAGLVQYFYYPSLRNLYYLGWDEHLYRLFSTFLDPNYTGVYLVLTFFSGIFLLQQTGKQKKRISTFFIACLLCINLLGIFLTYSRSAYMSLGTGLVTLIFFQKKLRVWFVGILIIMLITIIFTIISTKKTEGTDLLRSASSFARIESYQSALLVWSKEPILGVGFNAYRYAQERNGLLKGEKAGISHSGAGVENSLLFVLATTGIGGLLSFGFFYATLLKTSFKQRQTNTLALTIFVCFIAVLISSLFINSLFYPPLMVWLFILAGLLNNTQTIDQLNSHP